MLALRVALQSGMIPNSTFYGLGRVLFPIILPKHSISPEADIICQSVYSSSYQTIGYNTSRLVVTILYPGRPLPPVQKLLTWILDKPSTRYGTIEVGGDNTMDTQRRKEQRKRYRQSIAGKEAERKYRRSLAGRETEKKYRKSPAGKAARRKYEKEYRRRYRTTPKGIYKTLRHNSKNKPDYKIVVVTREEFISWLQEQEQVCHYCGAKFTNSRGDSERTVDRKDNNLPYQLGNIVLSCRRCNRVKSNIFTETQMLEIAQRYFKVSGNSPLPAL